MVASLEAQYLQRQQNFSRKQRIKTVDGIPAKTRCVSSLS
jgi:protein TonB